MKRKSLGFILVDALYIAMMTLPIIAGIVLKILTKPASSGITVTGAQIYFTLPLPVQDLPVTESQINSLIVMITALGICLFLTHGLRTRNISRRQHLVEWAIEKVDAMTLDSMGEYFKGFPPFIMSILRTISAHLGYKHRGRLGNTRVPAHNLLQIQMRTARLRQELL